MLDALQTEVDQARERMFLMMGVRHERAAVTRAHERFESGAREQRANAVELLDNMLAPREKHLMLPMLEELDAAERLRRLRRTLPPREEPRTRDEWLIDVLARPPQWITPWTRACALWVMGQLRAMTFLESAVAALRSPEPLIRETAIWTLGELRPDDLSHTLDTLTTDTAQHVATMAREVLTKCS
jgi:HEAT repeat protein